MTHQEELTALETAYSGILSGGAIVSYSINGRSVTKSDIRWMTERIDQLRLLVARETGAASMFYASKFRKAE